MKTTKKDCVHSFCLFVKISTMEWSFLCHLLNQLFKHNYSQLLSYFIFPQCDSDGLLIIRVPTNEHFRISNATKCISNNFSPLFIHTSEQVDTEKEKKTVIQLSNLSIIGKVVRRLWCTKTDFFY